MGSWGCPGYFDSSEARGGFSSEGKPYRASRFEFSRLWGGALKSEAGSPSFVLVFRLGLPDEASGLAQWRATPSLFGGWPSSSRTSAHSLGLQGRNTGGRYGWVPANWGHPSAQKRKRVLVDSDGDNMQLANCVAAVLEQRDVCRPLEKAPHVPIAGMPTVSMSNEELQVDALSEMVDHLLSVKDFYGPFVGVNPGLAASEDCESPFTNLKTNKMLAEKYRVRHFTSIQQALEYGGLDTAHWSPGTENPADGLTKVRSKTVPLVRLLESGRYNPGSLRPL